MTGCCPEVLIIYSAVLSTVTFALLIVVTIAVFLTFRKHFQRQPIYCFPEGDHVRENSNVGVFRDNEDHHERAFQNSTPLLAPSRVIQDDGIPVDLPSQVEAPHRPVIPYKDHIQTKETIPRASRGTTANGKAGATDAAAQGPRGAVTLPRKVATQNPNVVPRSRTLKMINYELNKSEMFQRVSGEMDEHHPDKEPNSQGAAPESTPKVAQNPKRYRRRENDYQMNVKPNEENASITSPDPYYHKLTQDPLDDNTLDMNSPEEEYDLPRDLFHRFPLTKTADKKQNTRPSRYAKPTPTTDKTTKDDCRYGYESVNQNLQSEKEHDVVVAAEELGQYSKLQRNNKTDGTDFLPAEGYDCLMSDVKDFKETHGIPRRLDLSGASQ